MIWLKHGPLARPFKGDKFSWLAILDSILATNHFHARKRIIVHVVPHALGIVRALITLLSAIAWSLVREMWYAIISYHLIWCILGSAKENWCPLFILEIWLP